MSTGKGKENRRNFALALAAVFVLIMSAAGCGKNQEKTAAEETLTQETDVMARPETAAETAVQNTDAKPAEAGAQRPEAAAYAENDSPELLWFSLSQYERNYPGGAEEEPMGTASTELLKLETAGYEKLGAAIESINTSLISDTDDAFRNIAEIFQSAELTAWEKPMLPYSENRYLLVRRADSSLLSYTLTADFWTGGAHPSSWMVSFNLDPAGGTTIPLTDIVEDYDGFYSLVKEKLENSEEAAGYFEDWKDTLKGIFYGAQEPSYFVTDDAVFIYFDVYLLGPYAMGPVAVEFPLNEYRKLFKKQYFPEKMPENAEPVRQRVKSENSSKVCVSELVTETGAYTDDAGNTAGYCYKLPKISLTDGTSAYVDQVNAEIEELKKEYVDTSLETMKEGSSLFIYNISSQSVCYKGITSVLIEVDADFDDVYTYCYNFKSDGSKAENKDVFEVYGLTEAEFETLAKKETAEFLGYDAGQHPDNSDMGRCDQQTLDGITGKAPVYIAKADRSLRFAAGIYTIAGSGYYTNVLKIPGTEHRPDGLTEVQLNPQTRDNIRKAGDAWYIRDAGEEQEYILDAKSIVAHTVPAFEYGDTVDSWMQRYLSEDTASGFAMGDIIYVLVDKTGHIEQVEAIYFWD